MKRLYSLIIVLFFVVNVFAGSDVKKLGSLLPSIDLSSSAKIGDKLIIGGDMGFFLEFNQQKNLILLNKSNANDELSMFALIGSIDEAGYAVGTGASVFKFENNTWTKIDFPFNNSLRSIKSYGNNRLIITAANGKFYTSNNNGTSWKEKNASILLDINCSIEKDNQIFLFGNNGLVISSSDFFETFSVFTGNINGNIAACCGPNDTSNKLLLFTQEGQIVEMNTTDNSFSVNYENADFTFSDWAQNNETIVATASETSVLVSENRGITWTEKSHNYPAYFYAVEFYNDEFVLVGDDSYVATYKNNQFEKLSPETDLDFQEAEIFNNILFVGTRDGKVLKSVNFDNQWESVVEIPDATISGLATNGNDEMLMSTTGGEIYEMNSQSGNFTKLTTGIAESGFHGVYFSNSAFYCVSEFGNIYKKNGSWNKVYQTNDSLTITDLFIDSDSNMGFATGVEGKILKTTDDGETWNVIQSDLDFALLTVYFYKNTWYIGGMNGTLIFSSDGINWLDLSANTNEETFTKITAHPNGNDLLATTVSGKNIRFTDDGTNMEILAEGFSPLNDVVWKDKQTAYSVGHNSNLFQINLDAPVSAQKIINPTDFLVYPLPAKDILYVELPKSETISEYRIYNLEGKLYQSDFVKSDARLALNISELKPGIYLLKLEADYREFSQKFVVK